MTDLPLPPVPITETGIPENGVRKIRCFVTSVQVDRPEWNLYTSTIEFRADHAERTDFEGSFKADGRKFTIGDVIFVTIDTKGF